MVSSWPGGSFGSRPIRRSASEARANRRAAAQRMPNAAATPCLFAGPPSAITTRAMNAAAARTVRTAWRSHGLRSQFNSPPPTMGCRAVVLQTPLAELFNSTPNGTTRPWVVGFTVTMSRIDIWLKRQHDLTLKYRAFVGLRAVCRWPSGAARWSSALGRLDRAYGETTPWPHAKSDGASSSSTPTAPSEDYGTTAPMTDCDAIVGCPPCMPSHAFWHVLSIIRRRPTVHRGFWSKRRGRMRSVRFHNVRTRESECRAKSGSRRWLVGFDNGSRASQMVPTLQHDTSARWMSIF